MQTDTFSFRNTVRIIAVILIFSIIAGCSLFRPRNRAYTNLVEPFENLDTSPLERRIIVLDPGHGGDALGAVGTGGLEEKQVNLLVATRLKYYLERANARVIMTRTDDRDLIVERIDSLRGNDLDYRIRLSDKEEADLFISLHHNSNLPLDRNYSAIETYYKMEDYFSSKDAARLIHKHLVRNLQIPLNFLRPGNYYVLRNNTRTAVLGEASYISNPKLEKKLSESESIEIEAQSYFLGILDYFSLGVPKIQHISPEMDALIDNAMPVISISVLEDRFGNGIDPQSVLIGIDDIEIPYFYDSSTITASPAQPLTNGSHRLYVNVANLKGNHSLLYESRFVVDMPPGSIILTPNTESIPPDGKTPIAITAMVLDKNFNQVKDSTMVYFNIDEEPASGESAYTHDGVVHFYYTSNNEGTVRFTIQAGDISTRGAFSVEPQRTSLISLFINDGDTAGYNPLKNVLAGINHERYGYTNRDGFISFKEVHAGEYSLTAHLSGYYPASIQISVTNNEPIVERIALEPVYNRLLFAKRILIDPEFGGLSSGSKGPTGLQASAENMETARYLVEYLQRAGADARLTIEQGDDLTAYSRVRLSNEMRAELFVSLRHASSSQPGYAGVAAYAYPTSTNGKRLGELILNSYFALFNVRGEGPVESAEYVLQQTGCPAVIVNLGNIANPSIEEELYATWRNRREAYTVFTALVNYYAGDSTEWGEYSGSVTDEHGAPIGNALVYLNQTITVQTDEKGRFKFITLEPRVYTVTVEAKGYRSVQERIRITPSQTIQKKYILKAG